LSGAQRARWHTGQESIPIPIPTPTPIQTMIGLIGNHCLEEGAFSDGLYHWVTFLGVPEKAETPAGSADGADQRRLVRLVVEG